MGGGIVTWECIEDLKKKFLNKKFAQKICNFGESIYRLCSFNFIKIVISSEFLFPKELN